VSDFVETMKLVEKAREDIYFAKINRELIENLHRLAAAEKAAAVAGAPEQSGKAGHAGKNEGALD
jgi:hypothetical protein